MKTTESLGTVRYQGQDWNIVKESPFDGLLLERTDPGWTERTWMVGETLASVELKYGANILNGKEPS